MSFGYRALHRSDSFIHLSSASPSIMYRQPSRRASISSLTSELSSNVQSGGLEQGRLHGFLQRIGHRRRRRSGYSEQNNASEKENYVSLCDEMESCCPDPGPVSSLKVTDKHYGGDTDEMIFIKRHRHQRSQMAEAGSENDPATPMPQGSGGEPSWLKEMGNLHLSGHTRTVRSTSFNAHGEYLRLEEPVVNNYVRPVRRTSHGEYSDVEGEELKDLSRQMQRTFFNVNREYSRLKEMNGTGTENGHFYSAPLHCLTRQELHV